MLRRYSLKNLPLSCKDVPVGLLTFVLPNLIVMAQVKPFIKQYPPLFFTYQNVISQYPRSGILNPLISQVSSTRVKER